MRELLFLSLAFLLLSCNPGQAPEAVTNENDSIYAKEYLVCRYTPLEEPYFENENGDVIINIGEYVMSYSDTIRDMGMVMDSSGRIWAINKSEEVLFEVYNFDNGPDYVEEGLFRIVKDSLIGYADEQGNIVIEPQFKCAWPFDGDSAQVSMDCKISTEFEMTKWESDNWFYIDKHGKFTAPGVIMGAD